MTVSTANDRQTPRIRVRRGPSTFRVEIQILRAFAVAAVVLYHFWPTRLPGGFVGVDVFFVISGYLISAHLLREIERTGRIALPAFWARRARRLLPAALVVLGATSIGTWLFVPRVYWLQTFQEVVGSTLYAQNWVLANSSVEYLSAENVATPVQHFWSLSVEEQFYLVWPLLLVACALLLARRGPQGVKRGILVVMAVVFVASLAWCVHLTATDPGPAYFVTTTRAWEFAGGGLLAMLSTRIRLAPAVAAGLAWIGWALLGASLFVITPATAFPGWAALLPVVGTLVVIGAGSPAVSWAPSSLLARRPVLVAGDLSYSVYLWHWPLLVFAEFQLGTRFTSVPKVVLLVAVVVIAWLSHRYVEHPVRTWSYLASRPARLTLIGMVVAVAVIAVPVSVGRHELAQATAQQVVDANRAAIDGTPCLGAPFLDPAQNCPTPSGALVPSPAAAIDDVPDVYGDDNACISDPDGIDVRSCTFGTGAVKVALIGDSHAASWVPAMERLARTQDWTVTGYFKSRCPLTTAAVTNEKPKYASSCATWNRALEAELAASPAYSVVLVSHSVTDAAFADESAAVAGYREAWKPLLERGSKIVAIRDVPRVAPAANACLAARPGSIQSCSLPRAQALGDDQMMTAARGVAGVSSVDLTAWLCTPVYCPAAIGGVVTHRDSGHLTATYSATLAPYLGAALRKALS